MTPLHIKIALHYHTINEPYALRDPTHRYSDAVIAFTHDLVVAKLIVPNGDSPSGYHTTAALNCYVEALQSVPLPIQIWTIPERLRDVKSS